MVEIGNRDGVEADGMNEPNYSQVIWKIGDFTKVTKRIYIAEADADRGRRNLRRDGLKSFSSEQRFE